MKEKQARLITLDDQPNDVEVFKADDASDALMKAGEIFSKKGTHKKAAIWQPEDGQLDQALSHNLSDVYNQMAIAGYEDFDRELAGIGMVTRHRAGDHLSDHTLEHNSPLLLQILSAVQQFNNTSLVQAITTAKDVAIDINPHFDKKHIDVPSHASPKKTTSLKDLYNNALFHPEHLIRMIWNEKAISDKNERLGTLLWLSEDVAQLQMDAKYTHLIEHGNMRIAANYAKENFNLSLENARQVPNNSILFLGASKHPNPSDYVLHSIMPKDKTARGEQPWTMHAVDVEYTPPPKYPWLPLNPLA
jgi:hypothetical protein